MIKTKLYFHHFERIGNINNFFLLKKHLILYSIYSEYM